MLRVNRALEDNEQALKERPYKEHNRDCLYTLTLHLETTDKTQVSSHSTIHHTEEESEDEYQRGVLELSHEYD